MKLKAIIFREDRTNDVVVPKKKEVEGKSFRHDNSTYFINPDHVQITWNRTWLGLKKNYFATSYYIRGIANPLPVPDFKKVEMQVFEDGNPVFDKDGKPVVQQVFPKLVDLGVPGEELAAIFNPWFYRVIGNLKASLFERIQFLMIIGCLILLLFIAYTVNVNSPPTAEEIAAAIRAAEQAAQQATTPPPQGGAGVVV